MKSLKLLTQIPITLGVWIFHHESVGNNRITFKLYGNQRFKECRLNQPIMIDCQLQNKKDPINIRTASEKRNYFYVIFQLKSIET